MLQTLLKGFWLVGFCCSNHFWSDLGNIHTASFVSERSVDSEGVNVRRSQSHSERATSTSKKKCSSENPSHHFHKHVKHYKRKVENFKT